MRHKDFPKLHVGPMSKNIVNSVLEFSKNSGFSVGLIPSRRQVEYNGGYVSNWTTKNFSNYINGRLFITRDHAGPNQGLKKDMGYKSLNEDCKYFPMIHIDPWEKYKKYEEGLAFTIKAIKYCYSINPLILFEVGTEEAIRPFSSSELDKLLKDLKLNLSNKEWVNVRCAVIQSGTSLLGYENTGSYNESKLHRMCSVVKNYGLISKEHNGDYLSNDIISSKFSSGLDSINIAPEFGKLETEVYLDCIKSHHSHLFDIFYDICFASGRWKKWVNKDFKPSSQKEDLIKICGHYVLSCDSFINKVKNLLPPLKNNINQKINSKLQNFYEYSACHNFL